MSPVKQCVLAHAGSSLFQCDGISKNRSHRMAPSVHTAGTQAAGIISSLIGSAVALPINMTLYYGLISNQKTTTGKTQIQSVFCFKQFDYSAFSSNSINPCGFVMPAFKNTFALSVWNSSTSSAIRTASTSTALSCS